MTRALVVVAITACHAHPAPPIAATATATLGLVAEQLVDQGDTTYVFAHDKIVVARGDIAITTINVECSQCPAGERAWTGAASIAALDGAGRWIVASRYDGTLWRVRLDGDLEPLGARFGLRDKITGIAAAGSTIAIGLANGTAVTTDGKHVARYPTTGRLAVARDRVAIGTEHAVELWDLARGTSQTFSIANGSPMFVDADSKASRLVVTTRGALWLERAGALHPLGVPTGAAVAIAGARLWTLAGADLRVLVGDQLVPTVHTAAPGGLLFGSPTGDVWVTTADAKTALRRYSIDRGVDPRWQHLVSPVFQRVCSHCHLPGGDGDLDLSTPEAWRTERDEIVQRVIVDRTMPPAGTTLADPDRAAVASWLGVKP